MDRPQSTLVPLPWVRRLVIDAGRAARRRHCIHGLIEADVTSARSAVQRYRTDTGSDLSLTAFVIACIGRAAAADPTIQAYRDWRGREVVFSHVDVGLPIEVSVDGVPFAFTHVLRDTDLRSVEELHQELREVKADPSRSVSVHRAPWARAYLLLPGFLRVRLLGSLHRLPRRQRALAGTVGVTAVGMFGAGGGWGIAFQLHTLGVVIGGITKRPVLFQGRLVEREFLHLTISVDHDVVDGAPAARFVHRLRELLASAELVPVHHQPLKEAVS